MYYIKLFHAAEDRLLPLWAVLAQTRLIYLPRLVLCLGHVMDKSLDRQSGIRYLLHLFFAHVKNIDQ